MQRIVDSWLRKIKNCIIKDNIHRFKNYLKFVIKRYKAELVNYLLNVACYHGKLSFVKYLVEENGGDVYFTPNSDDYPRFECPYFGSSAFSAACIRGHTQIVEYLLKQRSDKKFDFEFRKNLLKQSVCQPNICKALLSIGNDFNDKEILEESLKHAAVSFCVDTLEIILNAGTDINLNNAYNSFLNSFVFVMWAPYENELYQHRDVSAIFDPFKCFELLTKYGADINFSNDHPALHLLVKFYPFNTKMNEHGIQESTEEYLNAMQFFIRSGADVNIKDINGQTALHIAVDKAPDNAIIEILIRGGANLDAKDKNGLTAIYNAIENGDTNITKTLIKNGASLFVKDNMGVMPIHKAAMMEDHSLIQIIFEIAEEKIPDNVKIEMFELIAVERLLNFDTPQALFFLDVSLFWRHSSGQITKPASFVNSVFGNLREPISREDLHILIQDGNDFVKQAILIYARIFGPYTTIFLDFLSRCYHIDMPYDIFYDENENNYLITKCILSVTQAIYGKQHVDSLTAAVQVVMECGFVDDLDFLEIENDIRVLFETSDLATGEDVPYEEDFHCKRIEALVRAIFQLMEAQTGIKQFEVIKELSHLMIELYRLFPVGDSLLHILIREEFDIGMLSRDMVHTRQFLEILTASENRPNIVDKDGNTPLHLLLFAIQMDDGIVLSSKESRDHFDGIIQMFLNGGLHIDMRNNNGDCILHMLTKLGFRYESTKYRSLQCLAAEAIGKIGNNVDIPKHLLSFVKVHSCPNSSTTVKTN